MGLDAPWHWIVLALIVAALFGYKKLPEMSRSVAQSLRVFKSEVHHPTDTPMPAAPSTAPYPAPVTPSPAPYPAAPAQPGNTEV